MQLVDLATEELATVLMAAVARGGGIACPKKVGRQIVVVTAA